MAGRAKSAHPFCASPAKCWRARRTLWRPGTRSHQRPSRTKRQEKARREGRRARLQVLRTAGRAEPFCLPLVLRLLSFFPPPPLLLLRLFPSGAEEASGLQRARCDWPRGAKKQAERAAFPPGEKPSNGRARSREAGLTELASYLWNRLVDRESGEGGTSRLPRSTLAPLGTVTLPGLTRDLQKGTGRQKKKRGRGSVLTKVECSFLTRSLLYFTRRCRQDAASRR